MYRNVLQVAPSTLASASLVNRVIEKTKSSTALWGIASIVYQMGVIKIKTTHLQSKSKAFPFLPITDIN